MKKSILSVIALTAALMISCVKSEEPIVENGYTFRFEISGENDTDAKATMNDNYLVWEQDDVLDFILEVNGTVDWNKQATIDVVDASPSFTFTSNSENNRELKAGTRIFCCYPRISNWKRECGYISPSQHITLPLIQTHKNGQFSGKNMPMVSVPFTFTTDVIEKRVGQMKFLNLGAMLEFKVFSSDGAHSGETVQDVIFEADKNIAGAFKFNLQNVDPGNEETLAIDLSTVIKAEHDSWQELPLSKMIRTESDATVGTTKDNAGSVRMVVAPGTYTGKVKVRTDRAYYVFNLTNKTFARNGHYPLGLDLSSATCVRTVMERMDQTKWVVKFCNATNGVSDWGYACINDGNTEKIWQGGDWNDWPYSTDDLDYDKLEAEGIYICQKKRMIPNIVAVMDMKQSVNVARIGIGVKSTGWPWDQRLKECEFFISDSFTFQPIGKGNDHDSVLWANYQSVTEGIPWKHLLTATVPHEEGGVYWYDVPSTVSEEDRTGRYLKIHPTKSNNGEMSDFGEIFLEYVPTAEVQ